MIKRLTIYLNEMFPITSFVGSIVSGLAIMMVYFRLHDLKPEWSLHFFLPALVLTLISLLIRVMDEFKDYEDDLRNYPHRPLPSGRVKRQDLLALGITCVVLIVFLSTTSKALLIWSLVTLGFTGLMLKWFFIEPIMRKSLPLALISHHPIVLFNFIYLIVACTQMNSSIGWEKISFILPVCLIYTNWEIVRKIRAPEQETAYTTYSIIWGPRPAIVISLFLQIIFNTTMWFIFQRLNSPLALQIIFFSLQFLFLLPGTMFFITLKLPRPLKPIAELQILSVVGTLLAAALL